MLSRNSFWINNLTAVVFPACLGPVMMCIEKGSNEISSMIFGSHLTGFSCHCLKSSSSLKDSFPFHHGFFSTRFSKFISITNTDSYLNERYL